MTEEEWMECNDPAPMLSFRRGSATDRKLRLFACATVRRIWYVNTEGACRRVVDVCERHANGTARDEEVRAAYEHANRSLGNPSIFQYERTQRRRRELAAAFAALGLAGIVLKLWNLGTDVPFVLGKVREALGGMSVGEHAAQAGLLRDLFGNPFRPVTLAPICLTPTATQLAQAIYDNRTFAQLPILADALEEAGCNQEELLQHLRSGGEHVRGCWALDLVLGKQ